MNKFKLVCPPSLIKKCEIEKVESSFCQENSVYFYKEMSFELKSSFFPNANESDVIVETIESKNRKIEVQENQINELLERLKEAEKQVNKMYKHHPDHHMEWSLKDGDKCKEDCPRCILDKIKEQLCN